MRLTHQQFRDLAWKCGLAATHQRQVVYEAVIASHGHHSPEQIYAAVKKRIPSISLATVYNNLRLFCSRCKSVQDIEGDFFDFKSISRQIPEGFDLSQPVVEVFGLCRRCRANR